MGDNCTINSVFYSGRNFFYFVEKEIQLRKQQKHIEDKFLWETNYGVVSLNKLTDCELQEIVSITKFIARRLLLDIHQVPPAEFHRFKLGWYSD